MHVSRVRSAEIDVRSGEVVVVGPAEALAGRRNQPRTERATIEKGAKMFHQSRPRRETLGKDGLVNVKPLRGTLKVVRETTGPARSNCSAIHLHVSIYEPMIFIIVARLGSFQLGEIRPSIC